MDESCLDNSLPDDYLPEDTLKILVATDNHLGYGERKSVIDEDSYRTFEEILLTAASNEADFILLGGDLFHECQPSPYCIYKCTELLRKHCLGDKPVSIEFLSDQSENFKHLKNPIVNYEDPNLNISMPVFSIHGNHDDPSGTKQISALDILSTAGLVNYFGRWTDLGAVEIRPVLLKKGKTKLALYGLSHIPDQRLARLFKDKLVTMPRPEGEWFNLFVLHQNRANRGVKNFIPSSAIPNFIDLVIWGHEHDCRIIPEDEGSCIISQPGSSVATSLAEGESRKKHVGLLKINKTVCKMIPIPLKTVRPFIFNTIELIDPSAPEYSYKDPRKQSEDVVRQKVNEMIAKAAETHTDRGTKPPLPLIRLNVKYYNESQVFNAIRVGHEFEEKVANPADIIKISKLQSTERRTKDGRIDFGDDLEDVGEWATRVEDIVLKYFESDAPNRRMGVLQVKALTEAVSRFVCQNDTEAVAYIYATQLKDTFEKVKEKNPRETEITTCLQAIRQKRLAQENRELEGLLQALNEDTRPIVKLEDSDDDIDLDTSDEDLPALRSIIGSKAIDNKQVRGRGSRGRGAARAGTNEPNLSDSDVEELPVTKPARGKGSRGPRGGRASANTRRTTPRRGSRAN